MVIIQNVVNIRERGASLCRISLGTFSIVLVKIPRTDHRTSLDTISNVPRHFLSAKLIGKSHRPLNKTFIRGSSPGVSDVIWA